MIHQHICNLPVGDWCRLIVLGLSLVLGVPAWAADSGGATEAPPEPAGMRSLFNGRDLTGWDGDPRLWSVRDGVIRGETTEAVPAKGNTFLILAGQRFGDFELRLSFRCTANNNSGIQYRSRHITGGAPANRWVVRGYQHELRNENQFPNVSGFIYDEGGKRGRICLVGERAVWESGVKRTEATLLDAEAFRKLMKVDDWNDVVISARGSRMQHYLNGRLILDFTDKDPQLALTEGILALQLHAGKPMWTEFKNLRIRELSGGASVSAVPGAPALSQIRVQGNAFVNAQGETVVFRGLNTSDPDKLAKNEHWNREYFEQARAWGANAVRIPVHPEAWRLRGRDNYLKLLDEGVAWAGELGMYVVIDWHSIGNLRTEMYQVAGSPALYETTKKETFEFWRTLSQHYKANTTVAFFELFNEPTTYNGQLGTCTWAQWKELMEELITIVRANGSKAVPLVAGFNWAYDLTPVAADPIKAEGIAYVSHPYPMKRQKPWEPQWTKDWGYVAEKYPVFLTEIGFCGENDRGAHVPVISDESYGDAITAYCSARGISYCVWVFDPDWSPMLFTDWNFTPSRQGTYFKRALQAR